jgi:hypothetical protein
MIEGAAGGLRRAVAPVPAEGTLTMSMVCPQCEQNHEQLLQCPQCHVRLLYHAAALQPALAPQSSGRDLQWQQNPWGKFVVGLILAQGLYYGLHNLALAGLALRNGESVTVWQTLGGLLLSHGLQALGLLIGGGLCGAGQRHGAIYGCLLGLANGLTTLIVQRHDLEATASLPVLVVALPPLHMVLGALGGLLGALIWAPTPLLPQLEVAPRVPAAASVSLFSPQLFSGPMHLWRICGGIVVVVIGVGWSNAILQSVVDMSGGHLNVSSHLQAKLVGWEIAALAALLGAGFAGATTLNGFKQGFFVGLGASIVVAMIQMANPKGVVETMLMTVGCILLLTVAGGWFGGQLFPPILRSRRPRRSSYA